jgi:hypothetical protein
MVNHMSYPSGMARRQVLVQLDDTLVDDLDHLAGELGTSRSELLRRGARAVLLAAGRSRDDARLVESYRETPLDPDLIAAAQRLAARTVPEW